MSSRPTTITFPAPLSRRFPDPAQSGVERHVLFMRVQDVPDGIPKEPNPRDQRVDRGIYRDVRDHLLNDQGTANTFHLKNKGITLIASKVRLATGSKDVFEVTFAPGDGIVDGGHTYAILRAGANDFENRADFEQFVKIEIIVGADESLIPEIARGLNTAVQVQEMSLANLKHEFDWIKDELADEPYFEKIAFRENQVCDHDVRDLIVLLDLFNIVKFPNAANEHPVRAFSSKSFVLNEYLSDRAKGGETYLKARPLLKDILTLHDTISFEARELHNKHSQGKAASLAFVDKRKRGLFDFPFIDRANEHKLMRGALFPMLGAFRWMVVENAAGEYEWSGGFDAVLELWRSLGGELMRQTQATSVELARNPNQIGKSRNHWATLHSTVAKHQLISAR